MGSALFRAFSNRCCCDDCSDYLEIHNFNVSLVRAERVCCENPDPFLRHNGVEDLARPDESCDDSNTHSIPISLANNNQAAINDKLGLAFEEKFESLHKPPSVEDEIQYMRLSLISQLEKQESPPKECMFCMEGFTKELGSEVYTLCRCGENKHSFHLQCILRWVESTDKQICPVCNSELYYDDSSSFNKE